MDKKPLQVWCSLLGVSRQAYYDRLEREGIQAVLTTVIINAVLEIRAYLPKSGFRQLLAHALHFRHTDYLCIKI